MSARARLVYPRAATEAELQANVCTFMAYQHPALWRLTFHVPNGMHAGSKTQAARMVGQGMRAGVADLICLQPRGRYHYFALELKRVGERPTSAQLAWLNACEESGGAAGWADNFADACAFINAYARLRECEEL